MKTVCITHNDLDGKCAGAIVKFYNPNAYVVEITYGRSLPLEKIEDELIICDFTPETKEDFEKLLEKTRNITWIDHHIKNYSKYPEYSHIEGLRIDTKPSAALLTWQYYFPDKSTPDAVKYVSDFDTWSYDYGDATRHFCTGTKLYNVAPNSVVWKDLFLNNELTKEIIDKGKVIFEFIKNENENHLKQYGFEIVFEGYRTIVCNCGRQNSTFFDSVKPQNFDIMMLFNVQKDIIHFSLYTEKDISMANIAYKWGGGGHPKAAGFNLPIERIKEIIK